MMKYIAACHFLFTLAYALICQATEEKAAYARLSSFVGALALGDLVKSTLGPKGMNKILQSVSSGDINVTNDGATILKAIQLDNAAAKILVNISKVQDDEVGDGTTSVTSLFPFLLHEPPVIPAPLSSRPVICHFATLRYDVDAPTTLASPDRDGAHNLCRLEFLDLQPVGLWEHVDER